MADGQLRGQVALVTGGGRGLGRAIALALAAAGAAVGVCARSEDELAETARQVEALGGRALAVTADVGDRADVERSVATVERELGPLDLLVNNAGVAGPIGPFAEIDADAWWRVQEINLRGPVYGTRAALPGMLTRGRGRIVNMSSGASQGPWPMLSAYAVSKAALERFTENVAAELADRGIVAVAIHPGLVHTAMVDLGLESTVPSVRSTFRQWEAEGTMVPPERAAKLVVAVAAGKADALSGRYLSISQNMDVRLDEIVARAEEIRREELLVLRARPV